MLESGEHVGEVEGVDDSKALSYSARGGSLLSAKNVLLRDVLGLVLPYAVSSSRSRKGSLRSTIAFTMNSTRPVYPMPKFCPAL